MYTVAVIRPIGHNVGNHAINFALRHMLYETFGRLVSIIDYPATNKHESTAKAGLTPATVHEINRFADGVIVGGGNLFENDELAVDARALNALQPPLLLFSNSRGRIYDRHGNLSERSDVMPDSKLKVLLTRASISLSRDSATHAHLAGIDDRDQLGWCPTISLNRYTSHLPVLPEREDVGTLISIRTPGLMNIPYRLQSQVQAHIETAIDQLREAGHRRIRLLCNDSRDLDFATAFRYTKNVDSIHTSDVYQYLSLIKSARLILSYRLHATLPGVAYGTPVINIAYDERAQCLIDDLGIASASLNLVELGADYPQALQNQIMTGGYKPEDHALRADDWAEKTQLQLQWLASLRSLMEEYLHRGRHPASP